MLWSSTGLLVFFWWVLTSKPFHSMYNVGRSLLLVHLICTPEIFAFPNVPDSRPGYAALISDQRLNGEINTPGQQVWNTVVHELSLAPLIIYGLIFFQILNENELQKLQKLQSLYISSIENYLWYYLNIV